MEELTKIFKNGKVHIDNCYAGSGYLFKDDDKLDISLEKENKEIFYSKSIKLSDFSAEKNFTNLLEEKHNQFIYYENSRVMKQSDNNVKLGKRVQLW